MLPTRELSGTGVATSAIGFGCAGLFRIPDRKTRRVTLDAAYDAGIRHFDVAPMYGLGLAETELAPFLKGRRADITVTTKFGIEPTLLAKGVARVQKPMRAFLAKSSCRQRRIEDCRPRTSIGASRTSSLCFAWLSSPVRATWPGP